MRSIKHGDVMLTQSKATAVYAASLGIKTEGRLGETMEESSAIKATELVVLSSLHAKTTVPMNCGTA